MIVFFYSPECPHCKKFMPTWNKFKAKYDKVLDIRQVNGNTEPDIIKRFDVPGFPTVYVLNGKARYEYNPPKRTMASLEKFVRENYNPHMMDDLRKYYNA